MQFKNQIILSLGLVWIAFLGIVYLGVHEYLLSGIINIESDGGQQICINQYGFTHIINQYLMLFMILGLILGGYTWYLLRVVFMKHSEMVQTLRLTLESEAIKMEELREELKNLKKCAEKSNRLDSSLHGLFDQLNSVGTSVSLVKEKIQHLNDEGLLKELTSLERHLGEINQILKSI